MAMKKKTKVKLIRRARTEDEFKQLLESHSTDLNGLDPKVKKALLRFVFKSRRDFKKACEKYSVTLSPNSLSELFVIMFKEMQ